MSRNEDLQKRQLLYTTYNQAWIGYRKALQRRAVFKSMWDATTEYPPLKAPFYENEKEDLKKHANFSNVGWSQVVNPARYVDDDIGMPLNLPFNQKNQKTYFLSPQFLYGGK